MKLTDNEKREILKLVEADKPLPCKETNYGFGWRVCANHS